MFPRYTKQTDLLQLSHLHKNCDNLTNFNLFVQNVAIDSKQSYALFSWESVEKLIKANPTRWVIPVRRLCMRFIQQVKIINSLHVIFLIEAVNNQCIIQALPVVEAEAVPVKLEGSEICQFLFLSFIVYFKLKMYRKAFKKLSDVITKIKKDLNSKNYQLYVVCYLLLCRFFREVYIKKQTIFSVFGIDILGGLINNQDASSETDKLVILQNLIQFALGKEYNQALIVIYINQSKNKSLLTQIYQLSCDKTTGCRVKVEQFKAERLQRLKTGQVHNMPVKDPEVMKGVNKLQKIARYDCKQKILYINHENATEEQINELITKCFQLQQALKQMKNIRDNQFLSSRSFGGFGLGKMAGIGSYLGKGLI